MNSYYNPYELYHHGIKGQRWGVRRFQNTDGTYTSAGKRRRNFENGGSSYAKSKSGVGKKIATGLAIGAAVGLTAYALANPKSREYLKKFAGVSVSKLKSAATNPKVKEFIASNGKKAASFIGDRVKEGGKAFTDAAIAATGAIAVTKLTSNISTGNADADRILTESTSAAITAMTKPTTSSGNKYKSGPIDREKGAEISKIVGPPKQKEIDRTGPEYQALFKDQNGGQRDPETRSTIKSMASAGYGVDQISEYLYRLDRGEIRHSMINFYNPYELYHHGIKGQRWGVRRFQNSDGSLKAAGKKRYGDGETPKPTRAEKKAARKEKAAAALKSASKFMQKAAKVASSVSVATVNKYGSFKIGDFSDDAESEGKATVERLGSANIYAPNSTFNVYQNNSGDRAAAARKEKYDSLPDEVKKDRSIGKPSGKPIDKSSQEYQDLFKDDSPNNETGTRNPKTRKLIKDMADAGYDTDQIRKKLNKIDDDWDNPYNEQRYKSDQKWEEHNKSIFDEDDWKWDKDDD